MGVLSAAALLLRALLLPRLHLVAENLALRQQVIVLNQSANRVRLKPRDRLFWVLLRNFWSGWKSVLVVVQPETVVRWHRMGFRLFWRWKSTRGQSGRPKVTRELRNLILCMSRENPTWGAPRITDEIRLLGYDLCRATVAKYMARSSKPPSQTWRIFLANHAKDIAACDFFTMPTATFRVLYCFVIINHDTRRVIHFNVTEHPTALWASQQVTNAFPFDEAPRYLLRDNDSIYGNVFQERVKNPGIEEVRTAYHAPWQNAYAERVIGSIRRECLDHMIVLNEAHLKRILSEYFEYYNEHRAHQGIDGNAPMGRNKEPPDQGEVVAIPYLGGLHHRYTRQAA